MIYQETDFLYQSRGFLLHENFRDYFIDRTMNIINHILFNKIISDTHEELRKSYGVPYFDYLEKIIFPLLLKYINSSKSYYEVEIMLLRQKQNDLLKSTQFKYIENNELVINEMQKTLLVNEVSKLFLSSYLTKHDSEEVNEELGFNLKDYFSVYSEKSKTIFEGKLLFTDFIQNLHSDASKDRIAFYFLFFFRNLATEFSSFEYEFIVFPTENLYDKIEISQFYNCFLDYSHFIQKFISSKTMRIVNTILSIEVNFNLLKSYMLKEKIKILLKNNYPTKRLDENRKNPKLSIKMDTIIIKLYGKDSLFFVPISEIINKIGLITNRIKHIFIHFKKFSDFENLAFQRFINKKQIIDGYEIFLQDIISIINNEIEILELIEICFEEFHSNIKYNNTIMSIFDRFLYIFANITRQNNSLLIRNIYSYSEEDGIHKNQSYLHTLDKLKNKKFFLNRLPVNFYLFENNLDKKNFYFLNYFLTFFTESLVLESFNNFDQFLDSIKEFDPNLLKNIKILKIFLRNSKGLNIGNLNILLKYLPKNMKKIKIIVAKFSEEKELRLEDIKINCECFLLLRKSNFFNFQINSRFLYECLNFLNTNLLTSIDKNIILSSYNFRVYKDFEKFYVILYSLKKGRKFKKVQSLLDKKQGKNFLNLIFQFSNRKALFYKDSKEAREVYSLIENEY